MKTRLFDRTIVYSSALATLLTFMGLASLVTPNSSARILDDFDDGNKSGWADFTFVPGFGLPVETDGQFKFEQGPAGRAIFSASQKNSESFELKEGRTVEFRVDVVEGGAKDSFAILAFIPELVNGQPNSPGTLAGYGLAKSTTDVLITKGINKYFVADAGPAANLKNNNITLVLSLTTRNGNVIIHAQALDKDNGNAVIWDRTVIDTPEADTLIGGADDPKTPFITKGYFTLYLYQDFAANAAENPYKIYYDNAEVFVNDSVVLDNFDDNTKTDWADFTFVPGFGLPVEADGQFKFEQGPAGRAIFSASQKTSRKFELKDGERSSFSVDLVEGGAKDSFAILAFIPDQINGQPNNPGTLAGYGLAKSTTDVLMTKGINKYFLADAGPAANLKNNNITLKLDLEGLNGNLIIHASVLDKDNENAVIWERTVIDTPEADTLIGGADDPKAPFFTTGYVTLYLYQDFAANAAENPYKVYYDNLIVSAPAVTQNVAPLITETAPADYANFLSPATSISFKISDDAVVPDSGVSVTLNGTTYTTANGLQLSGAASSRTASLAGKLAANISYEAVIQVTDAGGLISSKTFYFDTFDPASLVIEAEDYNFGGAFINAPSVIPEGNGPQSDSYDGQAGVEATDFHDTRTTPNGTDTLYRRSDPVRMQRTLDIARTKYVDAGGTDAGVYDYDVGDIVQGEWMNYTREFPSGAYEVYLREAVVNMATGESVLEQVTSDPAAPDQTVKTLGSFLGVISGYQYRNFALTDGSGANKIRLNLNGAVTLRLRHVTTDDEDGGRFLNYLTFIRVGDIEVQRAIVASLSPTPNSTQDTLHADIRVELQNRDTTVKNDSITLVVNGQSVVPTLENTANGVIVSYTFASLPISESTNTATISFKDSQDQTISSTWQFLFRYPSLNPANRVSGTPGDSGMNIHVVQAPAGSNLANSILRAEDQIKNGSSIPRAVDVIETAQTINYDKKEGEVRGVFPDDITVPGIPGIDAETGASTGLDDFTVEVTTYLKLEKGIYRFGVISDDGFKLSSGKSFSDLATSPLDFHTGGPANQTIDFVVHESGLYPFRMLWYERGGAGFAEWFSENISTGERTLINDPNSTEAIRAYLAVNTPTVTVESSTSLDGTFTAAAQISIDPATKTITIDVESGNRFFKLFLPDGAKIKSTGLVAGKLVVIYE